MADVTAPVPFVATRRQRRMLDMTYQPGFRAIAYFCLFMLYAPILVLVVYSFNANRSVTIWTGFSIDWFIKVVNNDQIKNAALTSFKIAVVATIGATIAATAAALATTRTTPYRGLASVYVIINLPLMVPEIVTAVATLSFFAIVKIWTGYTGLAYLIAAHTAFCIPFAYLPIRARLEDMDRTLEQAAADLYASPWHAFRRVTLPLLTPGIIAGAMLAFITSIDDVTITTLVAGPGQTTLPIYIFGQIRRGITPETNAVSTIMLAVSVLLVSLFFFLAQRRKK